MPEPIRQKIEVDADEAIRDVDRMTGAEQKLGDTVERAGSQTKETGDKSERAADQLSGLQRMSKSAELAFAGLLSTGALIVKTLGDIEQRAEKAAAAIEKLGGASRGLAANVGGERSQGLVDVISGIAAENRLDTAGRDALVEFATSETDREPDLGNAELLQRVRDAATVQRATEIQGAELSGTLTSLRENIGIPDERLADVAVTLFNSGVKPRVVQELAARVGPIGGERFLALLLGARQKGLDLSTASEGLNVFTNALTATDSSGALDPALTAVGVTPEMDIVERLRRLGEARAAGLISDSEFRNLIGGTEALRVVAPLLRTAQSDAFEEAQAALRDPMAAERAIEEQRRNEFVRAQERANLRDLQKTIGRERSMLGGAGESIAQFESDFEGVPGPLHALVRYTGLYPSLLLGSEDEADMERIATGAARDIGAGSRFQTIRARVDGGPIQEHLIDTSVSQQSNTPFSIGNLYINATDPGEVDTGRGKLR